MTYNPGYDNYDPYVSRSLSRRPSIGYSGTPYPHQVYPDGIPSSHLSHPGSEYQQPYQIYAPPSSTVVPIARRLTSGYDTIDEPYYNERPLSVGHHSMSSMAYPRHRRHSNVSFATMPPAIDPYRLPSSIHIKFRRKGSFVAGIGLDEAQSHIRLSGNDAYSFHDLHADSRRRIYLRIKWVGYSSLTYEIPLDGYDGRLDLQTLARRISRACVHYLQANVIPIPWDRVQLHHLEEVSYGVWQPMLSTR